MTASPLLVAVVLLAAGASLAALLPSGRASRIAQAVLATLAAVPAIAGIAALRVDDAVRGYWAGGAWPGRCDSVALVFAVLIAWLTAAATVASVAAGRDPSADPAGRSAVARAVRAAPLAASAAAMVAVGWPDPDTACVPLGAAVLLAVLSLARARGSTASLACFALGREAAIAIGIGLLGGMLAASGLARAGGWLTVVAELALAGGMPFGLGRAAAAARVRPPLASLVLTVPFLAGACCLMRALGAAPGPAVGAVPGSGATVLLIASGLLGLAALPRRRGDAEPAWRARALSGLVGLPLIAIGAGGAGGMHAGVVCLGLACLLGQAWLLSIDPAPGAGPARGGAGGGRAIPMLASFGGIAALVLLVDGAARVSGLLALPLLGLAAFARAAGGGRAGTGAGAVADGSRLPGAVALCDLGLAAWLGIAMPAHLSDVIVDAAELLSHGVAG